MRKVLSFVNLCAVIMFLSAAQATDMGTYGGVGTESLFLIDANGKTLQLRPGTLGSSFSLTLPTADGSSNQYLQTNGSGVLSWGTPSGGGNPSGTIIAFAGASCPTGYFAADGAAVSRSTYSSLFNAISTTWGVGDGTTTFNVPDLRNRFMRGTGTNADSNGGDTVTLGAYQADEFKQHNHGSGQQLNNAVSGVGGTFIIASSAATQWNSTNAGGNESRPKSYGVLYCIAQ